jgi:molecular chaperone GrpE
MTPFPQKNKQQLLQAADLSEEIERLHAKVDDEHNLYLRTMADFKNYRRRIERDGNSLAREGKREIILQLLEIIDDMDRSLQWGEDGGQNLLKGVQNIQQKSLTLLENLGVIPIDSLGTQFDPDLHEAVSIVEQEVVDQGTVIDEMRRGYLWENELLRPAQVTVAG